MESFDFAVGLGPVGAGPLRGDVEFGAGVTPGVGAVGGSVVGEDPFDGDAMIGEPGDGSLEHTDRGGGFLVGADLGVGHAGMIVDDGVQERSSDPGS